MQFPKRLAICSIMLVAEQAGLVLGALASEIVQSESAKIRIDTLMRGLNHPWGMAFIPGHGGILITERAGNLRLLYNGKLSKPISGLPKIAANGQGGLLDVAVDPDFSSTSRIFFTYSEPGAGGTGTAVASAILSLGGQPRLSGLRVIFTMNKKTSTVKHYGSRIAFAPDKTMFVTLGERGGRKRAQDPLDHAGSIIRINRDGSIPDNNPNTGNKNALPEIWSIGHRNPQGAAINPKTGQLWITEHGARGGDELNSPKAGKNYGWPIISYGRHYTGFKIGVGTKAAGMEQPVHYWDPSIAPSGLAFYAGDLFKEWKGNIFVGALKHKKLVRLVMENNRVIHEEDLFKGKFGRIRDVRNGPNGALWLLTDDQDGKLLRLTPEK
jgi:glucose/arabinose dehydrogenase